MTQIENDPNLSGEGKKRKKADIAREVFAHLPTLIELAESAAGRRIEKLREKIEAVVNDGMWKTAEGRSLNELYGHLQQHRR
jgi:hypothetical protein